MNSSVTYSCGPLYIDEQRQDDQQEPTYNSSVPIQNVALKTCLKQLMIEKGGEKGSGISVSMAQHDDDDDDDDDEWLNSIFKKTHLKTYYQDIFLD